MKTLFIVSDRRVNKHVGEEYDYILEVDDQPTTETIQEIFTRVRTRIRALWHEQVKPEDPDAVAINPKVVCHLDAASPFVAMLLDLQIVLKEAEGIEIELPGLEEFVHRQPQDAEARELLEKMENRN